MNRAVQLYRVALYTLLFAFAAAPASAADLTRVFYPTQESTAFTVDIPSDWEMTPQEDEESYFEVEGPKGLELSFRTVPGADIDKAIDDHVAYLEENFEDVKLEEPKSVTINGMQAMLLPGYGTDEDGSKREFGAGWFKLAGGQIGELWYNVADNDGAGKTAAAAALNSLKGK